jgi:hypothetical protein
MSTSNNKNFIKILVISFTIFIFGMSPALAQVVVIPLPADSVNKGLVPVAVGSIDSLGGISSGFGIDSVTNPSAGVYVITLSSTINPGNPIVTITPFTIGAGAPEIAGYEAINSTSFRVQIQNASGIAVSSAFAFTAYNVVEE